MPPERRLLLVGAGHAHLHLLRHASRLDAAGYRTTLVAPRWFDYSGTASGISAGDRDPAEGRIDVAALAQHHRVGHRPGLVIAVDPVARTATMDDGSRLEWDVVSFNIGSVVDLPPDRAARTPSSSSRSETSAASANACQRPPTGRGNHVAVVGGGRQRHRARRPPRRAQLTRTGSTSWSTAHASATSSLGAPHSRLVDLLDDRGVQIVTDAVPVRVDEHAVVLRDGTRLAHDVLVMATGLAPPPLATGAPLGGRNGFPVRATLQHRDHDDVYAAGDCADFLPAPLQRIGVHGVRQGPVLLTALEARASGAPAPVYRPQKHVLSILDLGGGTALAVRGRWWWLGRSSLALKRRIDRRWLETYRT